MVCQTHCIAMKHDLSNSLRCYVTWFVKLTALLWNMVCQTHCIAMNMVCQTHCIAVEHGLSNSLHCYGTWFIKLTALLWNMVCQTHCIAIEHSLSNFRTLLILNACSDTITYCLKEKVTSSPKGNQRSLI